MAGESAKLMKKSQSNRGGDLRYYKIKRDLGVQFVEDEEGNSIPYDEWEFKNKFIDYTQFEWPQGGVNAMEFRSTADDNALIANYRYPVPVGV